MHDEAATHYVDMIDQTTLGHRYIKQQFDVTPRIGWQIDPFGHSAVQAYLLGAEVDYLQPQCLIPVDQFCRKLLYFWGNFWFSFVLKMLLQNHSALSKFCKMNRVPIWCLCCSWVLMPSSLQELTIKICYNAAKIGLWR
jgi:hypothetical protein